VICHSSSSLNPCSVDMVSGKEYLIWYHNDLIAPSSGLD
jgi:hypothetical protein